MISHWISENDLLVVLGEKSVNLRQWITNTLSTYSINNSSQTDVWFVSNNVKGSGVASAKYIIFCNNSECIIAFIPWPLNHLIELILGTYLEKNSICTFLCTTTGVCRQAYTVDALHRTGVTICVTIVFVLSLSILLLTIYHIIISDKMRRNT